MLPGTSRAPYASGWARPAALVGVLLVVVVASGTLEVPVELELLVDLDPDKELV